MHDKPADPYPFLQNQLAMRMSAAKAAKAATSPTSGAAIPSDGTIPALTTLPLMTVPAVQDSDADVTSLLSTLKPEASTVTPEDIANLERQALEASQRLREDNEKLRDTAMQMKLEYEKLMQESQQLHTKLDIKRAAKVRTQEAYVEIEKLQDEV